MRNMTMTKNARSAATALLPPIDAKRPEELETITFSLG